jgi:phenylacetate-CoA ligase
MIPLLTYLQFNGYPIVEAKAELQKIAFTAIEKENFIESKKKKLLHSI